MRATRSDRPARPGRRSQSVNENDTVSVEQIRFRRQRPAPRRFEFACLAGTASISHGHHYSGHSRGALRRERPHFNPEAQLIGRAWRGHRPAEINWPVAVRGGASRPWDSRAGYDPRRFMAARVLHGGKHHGHAPMGRRAYGLAPRSHREPPRADGGRWAPRLVVSRNARAPTRRITMPTKLGIAARRRGARLRASSRRTKARSAALSSSPGRARFCPGGAC